MHVCVAFMYAGIVMHQNTHQNAYTCKQIGCLVYLVLNVCMYVCMYVCICMYCICVSVRV